MYLKNIVLPFYEQRLSFFFNTRDVTENVGKYFMSDSNYLLKTNYNIYLNKWLDYLRLLRRAHFASPLLDCRL